MMIQKYLFQNNHKIKIRIIEKILNFLYPNPKTNLYYINDYTLLIAILLTARSNEKIVNKVTNKLFNFIKSPYDLIVTPIKNIKYLIKKIGLYNRKSENIYKLSFILINKYNGFIPKDLSKLKKLPGVGHKTASVFLSHINNSFNVFPIDTHIYRMMIRWEICICEKKNIFHVEKCAKKYFKRKNWSKLHLQIIFYGREYSPSKKWNKKKDIIYQELLNKKLLSKR